MKARLTATYAILRVINKHHSLNSVLDELLAKTTLNERSLAYELSFGVIRWYFQLNAILMKLLKKPLKTKDQDLQALLLVGIYQLQHTNIAPYAIVNETVNTVLDLGKDWAKSLVNAVLRNFMRTKFNFTNAQDKFAHPSWLIDEFKKVYPDNWRSICEENNSYPPFNLRINTAKISREEYVLLLKQQGITANLSLISPYAITLDKYVAVNELPFFAQGFVSVQDEAAQLAGMLLEPSNDMRILDACAAPGGKTCHILELAPKSCVLALDISAERITKIEQNLNRLKLECTLKVSDASKLEDWWDGKYFDLILLDAPCSGTGVIRRNPDIKINRTMQDIINLQQIQANLLQKLWQTLAKGGNLLYATCSVLPAENNLQIANFLAKNSDAMEIPIIGNFDIKQEYGMQLLPQNNVSYHHDGFYYAKLTKI